MAITKLLCKPWAFGKPQVPSVMAEIQVAGFQEGPFGARCCKRLEEQAPVWPQTESAKTAFVEHIIQGKRDDAQQNE